MNSSDHINKNVVFIGGCPRSGTTLLGSILGGGKDCIVTPESHFKQTLLNKLNSNWKEPIHKHLLIQNLKKNFRFNIWETDIPNVSDLPEWLTSQDLNYFFCLLVSDYARKRNTYNWNTWIDHTPQNIENPLMLLHFFPNAKFIHLVRDPRAVAASILSLDWGPNNAKDLSKFWSQKLSFGLALEHYHRDRCLRVCFEDILKKPEETIQQICTFTSIHYSPDMLKADAFHLPNYTKKQHALVGHQISVERISAWKHRLDKWQIKDIEKSVGDLMLMMGYELDNPKTNSKPFLKKMTKIITPLNSAVKTIRFKMKKKFYGKY